MSLKDYQDISGTIKKPDNRRKAAFSVRFGMPDAQLARARTALRISRRTGSDPGMAMTDARLENLLERYRAEYEAGDRIALHEAVLTAVWNGIPVPQWAVPELETMIKLHAEGHFRRGKGIAGPFEESERRGRDRTMHSRVRHLLSMSDQAWLGWVGDIPQTQDNAFEKVAEIFTEAYRTRPDRKVFTRAMVKAAYYRVERLSSKKGDSSGSDRAPDV